MKIMLILWALFPQNRGPVLTGMQNADDLHARAGFAVDYQMGTMRVQPYRGREFAPFARKAGVLGDQREKGEQRVGMAVGVVHAPLRRAVAPDLFEVAARGNG